MEKAAKTSLPSIAHDAEWKLAKFILRFPEVSEATANMFINTSELCIASYKQISCLFLGPNV